MRETGPDGWFDTRTWTIVSTVAAASAAYAIGKWSQLRRWGRSKNRRPGGGTWA